jgi:uncharacterized protein YfaS (alpha-2-macroglobulin family)
VFQINKLLAGAGIALALFSSALPAAQAATITRFTPQGEIIEVRQVVAKFSESMVRFGDPKAADPFNVDCAAPGAGRWIDDTTWSYDFTDDLPPGLRCSFALKADAKTLAGNAFTGTTRFSFDTGGPYLRTSRPYREAGSIDEHQVFLLTLSGPAVPESITASAYCQIEGVADRVPLKLFTGKQRDEYLDAAYWWRRSKDKPAKEEAARRQREEARTVVAQCAQAAGPKAKVSVVWGPGVNTASGVATTKTQVYSFTVREPFTASMTCTRENAQAPCTPILPITVQFSAGVPREVAERFRLKTPDGSRKPDLPKEDRGAINQINFLPPLPEAAELVIEAPGEVKDESGRSLANASFFPLKTRTAEAPPLAKFASGVFGVLEFNNAPALPVTVRRIELPKGAASPYVRRMKVDDDAKILEWLATLRRYDRTDAPYNADSRDQSMLKGQGAEVIPLPAPKTEPKADAYPFEVVGVPFKDPGFYVVELESLKLGESLLARKQPMFVRTSSLVTNMAVHFRLGHENAAVWVTSLDKAQAVADAEVRITDCNGKRVWQGATDKDGIARVPLALENPRCNRNNDYDAPRYLVSARKKLPDGRTDMAFVLSTWNQGIETWRFNVPTGWERTGKLRAYAVLDRDLLRAGETVSLKTYLRTENSRGLNLLPLERLPKTVKITHEGSQQEFVLPLAWTGSRFATASWAVPKDAKLGSYSMTVQVPPANPAPGAKRARNAELDDDDESGPGVRTLSLGMLRVEEFRLPTMTGRVRPAAKDAKTPAPAVLVNPRELPVAVNLDYLSGGPAANHPVRVSAMLRDASVDFADYDGFAFAQERRRSDEEGEQAPPQRIVANKLPLTLNKGGTGTVTLKDLPAVKRASDLVLEATYADANGEVQTLSHTARVWPAGVVVGIKVGGWVSVGSALAGQVLVLDTAGKPVAGKAIEVEATLRNTQSYRKRLVGGFYAYDNTENNKSLGTVCKGKTDARGLVLCEIDLKEAGNIELTASSRDDAGNTASSSTSVWVTRRGELWFDNDNHDRMDLLPEKRRYKPGETAKFQVRMPFRFATALVSVEREGLIETRVVRINGRDPTVEVPIKPEYGPNVYVSVLAVRERLREVPWYSFFQWGWKAPVEWWHEWREYRNTPQPDALVDLTKPAFKLGIAEISVGLSANELKVAVTPDKDTYAVRGQAHVKVKVSDPNGKPLPAGTTVAFAAVDQALLELSPNTSWKLLDAMMARRDYGMETFTAQMYVVGKRHFGKKAAPPGGGGGQGQTRELFDTLLLWNPAVVLDANSEATLTVPLNDSLTSFALVAIADGDATGNYALFGTGRSSIRVTQDLQIVSGLPPLAREGDTYNAGITLRNTTKREMTVEVTGKAGDAALERKQLKLAPESAQEISWPHTPGTVDRVDWEIAARELGAPAGTNAATDRIKLAQRIVPAVPYTVQQATLLRVDGAISLPATPPADALPGKARIDVSLVDSLAKPMPGVRRFFEEYPFICLEQKTSKSIGLRDTKLWDGIMAQLPLYLDGDGLAAYFPGGRGYDVLTSYVLAASHEVGWVIPAESLSRMQQGLIQFVDGKLERPFWSPRSDLEARKIAAIEALSRRGAARPEMLDSIRLNSNLWPTHQVIDFVSILRRMPNVKDRDAKLAEAYQVLRSRLNTQGTRLGFSTEKDDYWWWLMINGDANMARLLLAIMTDPAWKDDVGRIVQGTLQRQQRGAWLTTTANLWGGLAIEKFGRTFESARVEGTTSAQLGSAPAQSVAWRQDWVAPMRFAWGDKPDANAQIKVTHTGPGAPWATVASVAAVELKKPFTSGYRITKTVTPQDPKVPGALSKGDVLRVKIEIDAQTDMTWVVVQDPIPTGATILGSGLGRDSAIESQESSEAQEQTWRWDGPMLAYVERLFEGYRAYYEFVPKGKFTVEYTVRLNSTGTFALPPTRVEAMYAPEMFGESPNAKVVVK